MKIRLEFVPQDLWVGLYWKATAGARYANPWFQQGDNFGFIAAHDPIALISRTIERVTRFDAYLCLVPMLPIHLIWFRPREVEPRPDPATDRAVSDLMLRLEEHVNPPEVR